MNKFIKDKLTAVSKNYKIMGCIWVKIQAWGLQVQINDDFL